MVENHAVTIEGPSVDVYAADPHTTFEVQPHGLALRHEGAREFIPFDGDPRGHSVRAREPLDPVLRPPFVSGHAVTGHALRTAVAAARTGREKRDADTPVHLLDPGQGCPALQAHCKPFDIRLHSLGLKPCSRRLLVGRGTPAALAVTEPTGAPACACASDGRRDVADLVRNAAAIAAIAPADAQTTRAALEQRNGAPYYFRPGPRLGKDATLELLRSATIPLLTLADLRRIAAWAKLPPLGVSVADLTRSLTTLGEDGIAGQRGAVALLPAHSAIVADWASGQVFHVGIETTAAHRLPARFLKEADGYFGAFIRLRAARPELDLLRTPLPAVAAMAMQRIAWSHGLARDQYRVRYTDAAQATVGLA